MLYEGEDESFFLFMGQPPERVLEEEIPPREYIFVVDVSGSMHGYPLDVSKALLRDLIEPLRPTDHFNVLLFAYGSSVLSPESLPASSENVERALEVIDRQQGGGRDPARAGPPPRHRSAPAERDDIPHHRDRHRRVHHGGSSGLRPDPGESR